MEWLEFLIKVVPGIITVIVLVVQLARYVRKFAKEKNWGQLIKLVVGLIAEAEDLYDNGADRKTWVLEMAQAGAETIDCNIDVDKLGDLIDTMCAMSKRVNVKGK